MAEMDALSGLRDCGRARGSGGRGDGTRVESGFVGYLQVLSRSQLHYDDARGASA